MYYNINDIACTVKHVSRDTLMRGHPLIKGYFLQNVVLFSPMLTNF